MVLISVNDSTMCCKPLKRACYDCVKKSGMTCFISLFSYSGSIMISYLTLHSCSVSAAIMMCQWHHVHTNMMGFHCHVTFFSLPSRLLSLHIVGAAPSCAVFRASRHHAVWPQLPHRAAHLADLQPHSVLQAPDSPLQGHRRGSRLTE